MSSDRKSVAWSVAVVLGVLGILVAAGVVLHTAGVKNRDSTAAGASRSGGSAYYRNCDAARSAGAAPIYRGEAGYRTALDRDGDGVACEPYRGR